MLLPSWLEVVQVVNLKVEIWTLTRDPKVRICFLFFWSKPSAISMFKKNGNRQCTKNEQNAKTLVWQTLHISKLPLALLRSKVVCNSLGTTSSLRKDFQDLWAHNFTTTYFPKAKTPAVVMSNNDHLQLRLFWRKNRQSARTNSHFFCHAESCTKCGPFSAEDWNLWCFEVSTLRAKTPETKQGMKSAQHCDSGVSQMFANRVQVQHRIQGILLKTNWWKKTLCCWQVYLELQEHNAGFWRAVDRQGIFLKENLNTCTFGIWTT